MESTELFVYGLLMSGFRNGAARSLQQLAVRLRPARIPGRLYDLGTYPAADYIPGHGQFITGELIRIPRKKCMSLLKELDIFEGIDPVSLTGPEYVRSLIPVISDDQVTEAWCYLFNGNSTWYKVIASGDYRSHVNHKKTDLL